MAKKVSRLQKLREDALALFDERALGSLTEFSNWQKFAHFWVLVSKSLTRNRSPVRASALAYVTVLAIIPMLAVVMSITSALLKQEGEEQIDRFIMKLVASVTTMATVKTSSVGARDRKESLWVDELHSSWVDADNWEQVAPRARLVNQSPLYYRALWLLARLSGSSEYSLRAISLFCGGLLCAGSYALVRR